MNTNVTLILLTHKSKKLVLEYIKKIYGKLKILIIDNSEDTNLKKLIEINYPQIDIHLIDNNGYGNAANYGSKLVETEYFLISNPDVKGITENCIIEFEKTAKKLNNKFSALGPRFLDADPKSHKQSIDNNLISEMKFISGACMFFNKKNFDDLKGFDENIFLYFEENDFCIRSHKINKNFQVNNIRVRHFAGTSVETISDKEKNDQSNLRTWHFIWSKFYYYKKHYGFFFSIIFFIPSILRIIFRISLYTIKNDPNNLEKYKTRMSGLISAITNKKSYKRI